MCLPFILKFVILLVLFIFGDHVIALSAEAIDLGRPYWILHPVSYHTPEAATTVSKCS